MVATARISWKSCKVKYVLWIIANKTENWNWISKNVTWIDQICQKLEYQNQLPLGCLCEFQIQGGIKKIPCHRLLWKNQYFRAQELVRFLDHSSNECVTFQISSLFRKKGSVIEQNQIRVKPLRYKFWSKVGLTKLRNQ